VGPGTNEGNFRGLQQRKITNHLYLGQVATNDPEALAAPPSFDLIIRFL
jgi:hypothetical protein